MEKKKSNTRTTYSRRRHYSSKRRRSTGGSGFLHLLKSIPLWGFILGGVGAVALYCFILFHFFVDPYSFQWKAIYGETKYPKGYTVRGIDISHHQQTIDWDHLRNANMENAPVTFVIIKATEGETMVDDNFNDNFYEARHNDFVRGAYHYLSPGTSAKRQAEFFLHQVHLEEGDLPPVLDVEDEDKWEAAGKSSKDIKEMTLTWLKIVGAHYHVKPIIYSNYKFRRDVLSDKVFDEYPFWVAHYYVEKPLNDIKWLFWQHTDCGRVDGIKGTVDCNLFNGTRNQLDSILIKEVD